MAADIGVGDWVECVDATPFHHTYPTLQLGALYCVREVAIDPSPRTPDRKNGVRLHGIYLPKRQKDQAERGWRLSRFRPIYRPRADLIESLKTPAKREGVPA